MSLSFITTWLFLCSTSSLRCIYLNRSGQVSFQICSLSARRAGIDGGRKDPFFEFAHKSLFTCFEVIDTPSEQLGEDAATVPPNRSFVIQDKVCGFVYSPDASPIGAGSAGCFTQDTAVGQRHQRIGERYASPDDPMRKFSERRSIASFGLTLNRLGRIAVQRKNISTGQALTQSEGFAPWPIASGAENTYSMTGNKSEA